GRSATVYGLGHPLDGPERALELWGRLLRMSGVIAGDRSPRQVIQDSLTHLLELGLTGCGSTYYQTDSQAKCDKQGESLHELRIHAEPPSIGTTSKPYTAGRFGHHPLGAIEHEVSSRGGPRARSRAKLVRLASRSWTFDLTSIRPRVRRRM